MLLGYEQARGAHPATRRRCCCCRRRRCPRHCRMDTQGITFCCYFWYGMQAQRYTVYDQHGEIVAHLVEEEGGLGRMLGRQLLRSRRPFTATVLSPDGQQVCSSSSRRKRGRRRCRVAGRAAFQPLR